MPSLEKIARTIAELAAPGMQPDDLFKAVRERHPKASKKRVRTAAFYALILVAEASPTRWPSCTTSPCGCAGAAAGMANRPQTLASETLLS